MKLIFLYGPPASGKYTIAKALAEKTEYKLFHNHLTVDLVTSIFPFDSDQLPRLSEKFRLEMFEEAAKANVEGIIFTAPALPLRQSFASGESTNFCEAVYP